MLLAAFLIYYVIATNIYASKGERFKPIVSLYTIISGSMLPTIKVYDVVVNLKIDDPSKLQEGDVITFISQSKINYGDTITHRINKITYDNGTYYFTTKGDNNLVPDEAPVEFDHIIGKVILKIPQLGQAQFFLLKQGSKLFLILIPSFGILIYDLLKMLNLFGTKKKVDKSLETKDNKLSKEEEEKLKQKIKDRLNVDNNKENNQPLLEDKEIVKEEVNKENSEKKQEEIIAEREEKEPDIKFKENNDNQTSKQPKKSNKNKNNNNKIKPNNNNQNKTRKNNNYNKKNTNYTKKNNNQNNQINSDKQLDIDVDKVLKKIKENKY